MAVRFWAFRPIRGRSSRFGWFPNNAARGPRSRRTKTAVVTAVFEIGSFRISAETQNRRGYGGFCFPAASNVQLIDPAPLAKRGSCVPGCANRILPGVAVNAGIGPIVWQFVNRGGV